jgi:hypothetical protein
MTVSQKSSPIRGFGPVLTRLVVASACIAFAAWGKQFCSDAISPLVPPGPYEGFSHMAVVLSWLLFFGPFAVSGLYALVRAGVAFYRVLAARRTPEAIQILPPFSGTALQTGQSTVGRFRTHSPVNEPLDDATRRRLDEFAGRAAWVSGVAAGTLFIGLGLAGFLLGWRYGHVIGFGLVLRFLIACGASVLAGAFILRETLAQPKTAWLAPLRAFTAIVARKLTEEEHRRRNGMTR